MDEARLREYLAEKMSLEQIAARESKHPSTVSYWLQKYGLKASGHDVHAVRGSVDPDRLRALVEDGASLRGAAEEIGVSYTTVRHWVRKLGLRTERMKRLEESRRLRDDDARNAEMTCVHHGLTRFIRRRDGAYRCAKCAAEAVASRRRRVKATLIERAGGACAICGYDAYEGALHFHHLDPDEKAFHLSDAGVTRSLARAAAEADKCVLLCANCHAEVESGVTLIPDGILSLKLAKPAPT